MVKHLLSKLRDTKTGTAEFRMYSDRIMRLLLEEALSSELAEPVRRQSPTGDYYDHYEMRHANSDYCAVTIIRAGDSMLGEIFNLIPGISIGKVLIQRDESSKDRHPVFYYSKLPEDISSKARVFVLDPMCATGGSAAMCIDKLKQSGVDESKITFVNLISCPEGMDRLSAKFPELRIITAAVDPKMNESRYIIPGLGDYGDRFFGSKLP
jgi:uracil phosphoribosyltransferase